MDADMNTWVAVVVTTLRVLGADTAESMIYTAMGMDIHKYYELRAVLVSAGFVTVKGNRVALTAAGESLADDINRIQSGGEG